MFPPVQFGDRSIVLNERGAEVRTLDLTGVQPPSPKPKALRRLRRRLSADTNVINIDGGSSMEGYLSLAISVPDGYHFSKVQIFSGFYLPFAS